MKNDLSRRDFVKTSVAAATAATVGVPMANGADFANLDRGIEWEKNVCRFCGVGCGVVVGTRDGHVAAVKGDAKCPVNRGLLCAKGHANANILYGAGRRARFRNRAGAGHRLRAAGAGADRFQHGGPRRE